MTLPDLEDCSLSAVELVVSCRPVGKRWATRRVVHGLSMGNRACAVRQAPAQPAVQKSTVHRAFRLSGRLRLGLRQGTEVGFVGRYPVQRLMRPTTVVPLEALGQAFVLCNAVIAGAQIDPFVFHRPPQSLDEDVVMTTSASVHADLDTMRLQHIREFRAGELAALIGVEDLRCAVAGQRLCQRRRAQVRGQRIRQAPSQHLARRPVQDGAQIQEPVVHQDVGDIGGPDVVRPCDLSSPRSR